MCVSVVDQVYSMKKPYVSRIRYQFANNVLILLVEITKQSCKVSEKIQPDKVRCLRLLSCLYSTIFFIGLLKTPKRAAEVCRKYVHLHEIVVIQKETIHSTNLYIHVSMNTHTYLYTSVCIRRHWSFLQKATNNRFAMSSAMQFSTKNAKIWLSSKRSTSILYVNITCMTCYCDYIEMSTEIFSLACRVPFFGKVSVGYLPNKRVLGLSKIAR